MVDQDLARKITDHFLQRAQSAKQGQLMYMSLEDFDRSELDELLDVVRMNLNLEGEGRQFEVVKAGAQPIAIAARYLK